MARQGTLDDNEIAVDPNELDNAAKIQTRWRLAGGFTRWKRCCVRRGISIKCARWRYAYRAYDV